MVEKPADEKQGGVAQSGVSITREQGRSTFPQTHIGVHAGTIITKQWFRHEGRGHIVLVGSVFHHVLVELQIIRHPHQRFIPHVDLALSAAGDFVMMRFDGYAHRLKRHHHFAAQVVQFIRRRDREISFLETRLVTEIRHLVRTAVPMSFLGIDEIESGVFGLPVTDIIKDKEFAFRSEVCLISNTRTAHIGDSLLQHTTRVLVIWHHR
ncbi:hypothetical protein BMS3Bbin04_01266 [bacterium BMS3Bbin04]|nr:hypothetical protein BMS3Bbin04_01266 [bacterium BMS3Bbin04]